LAIDYGYKRCGVAVTDPNKIIAQALTTLETARLMTFLDQYLLKETVETLVVGLPKQMNNQASEIEPHIHGFIKRFQQKYPSIPVVRVDERFTSKISQQTLLMAGAKKKQRQDKELIDAISATIILQTYLAQNL